MKTSPKHWALSADEHSKWSSNAHIFFIKWIIWRYIGTSAVHECLLELFSNLEHIKCLNEKSLRLFPFSNGNSIRFHRFDDRILPWLKIVICAIAKMRSMRCDIRFFINSKCQWEWCRKWFWTISPAPSEQKKKKTQQNKTNSKE